MDSTLEIRMRALDRSAGYTLLFTVDKKYLTLHYSVNALYSPFTSFDVTFLRQCPFTQDNHIIQEAYI